MKNLTLKNRKTINICIFDYVDRQISGDDPIATIIINSFSRHTLRIWVFFKVYIKNTILESLSTSRR